MTMQKVLLCLALISSALGAQPNPKTLTFNDNDPIDSNGEFVAKKSIYRGVDEITSSSIVVYFWGVFDGASVDIEVSANAGVDWVLVQGCEAVVLVSYCSSLVGRVIVRAVVSTVGASTLVSIFGFETDSIPLSVLASSIRGLLDGPVTYGDASGGLTQAADFFYDEAQGFLGIGTASPIAKLDVFVSSGDDGISIQTPVAFRSRIVFGSSIDAQGAFVEWDDNLNNFQFTAHDVGGNGFITLATGGGAERLRIDSIGLVGIGTTSPTYKLEIDTFSGSGYFGVTNTVDGDVFEIDTVGNVTVGTTTAQLLLPLNNDTVAPTLAFGDGDTGFFESTDDDFRMSVAGATDWIFSTNLFRSFAFTGPGLRDEASTGTNPVIFPMQANDGTGMGGISDEISLIVSGVEIENLSSSGITIGAGLTLGNPPNSTPPVACSGAIDGHSYWDTVQNLLCICDGVSWAGVGGGAPCI